MTWSTDRFPVVLSTNRRRVYRGDTVELDGFNFDMVTSVVLLGGATVSHISITANRITFSIPSALPLGTYRVVLLGPTGDMELDPFEVVGLGGLDTFLPTDHPAADYVGLLLELLPKGPAWTRRVGTALWKLLSGIAEELGRLHHRAAALLLQVTPSQASESLGDWETELGLPDPCSQSTPPTDSGRRAQVARKANSPGGCTAAYFEAVAALFGFPVAVSEYYPGTQPFKAGVAHAGDAISQGPALFTWHVDVFIPWASVQVFKAGMGTAGAPLRWWALVELECVFEQIKPSHTLIHFTYTAEPSGDFVWLDGLAGPLGVTTPRMIDGSVGEVPPSSTVYNYQEPPT